MERARYEIDPYNRLIIDEDGTQGGLQKFRQVLDGQFKVDEYNNLSYNIKAPLSEDENIPHQVKQLKDNGKFLRSILTVSLIGEDGQ